MLSSLFEIEFGSFDKNNLQLIANCNVLSSKSYFWIKTSWKYQGEQDDLKGKLFATVITHKGEFYSWKGVSFFDSIFQVDTNRNEVYTTYLTPNFRRESDRIRINIAYENGNKLNVESVKIEAFEPLVDRE